MATLCWIIVGVTVKAAISFKFCIQYELDHYFTNRELGAITPPVIVRWMCLKVYGNLDRDPNDNPTQG